MNFYNKVVEQRSDKLAISFLKLDMQEDNITYNTLIQRTDSYAEKLSSIGVSKGFKVALTFPNSINWICTYMALAKLDAIATLIDFTLLEKEINELIRNTEVNLVITTPEVSKKIKEDILCIDAFNDFKSINNSKLKTAVDTELIEKNVSTLLFSSGTTSVPSAIMQTTEHLYDTTISCLKSNKINDDQQKFLGLLPNNHIYGLLMNVYAPLVSGSNVRILEGINPDTLVSSFLNYKPTVMASVPKIAELLKTRIKTQAAQQGKAKLLNMFVPICYKLRTKFGINLGKKLFHSVHDGLGGCIDIFPTAGAPISPDTAKFFIGLGFRFMSTYGATETNIPTFGARGEDLQIDNVGKNSMFDAWFTEQDIVSLIYEYDGKIYQKDEEDEIDRSTGLPFKENTLGIDINTGVSSKKWKLYPRPYDMDSQMGETNAGFDTVPYYAEINPYMAPYAMDNAT